MRFRMVPTDDSFFGLFQAQANYLAEAAVHLEILAVDPDNENQDTFDLISKAETGGDDTVREIHSRLGTSFVTPFDREDIHLLAERLDDVLDDIYHVASLLHMIEMGPPMQEMSELCRILVEMANLNVDIMSKFESMRDLDDHLAKIGSLESEGDQVYRRAIARLFNSADAMTVLKWKDILAGTEHAIDRLEDVSDVIESVIVKHA